MNENILGYYKLVEKLHGVPHGKDGEYIAYCPAHNDSERQLIIVFNQGMIKTHCNAGCELVDVWEAIYQIPGINDL